MHRLYLTQNIDSRPCSCKEFCCCKTFLGLCGVLSVAEATESQDQAREFTQSCEVVLRSVEHTLSPV